MDIYDDLERFKERTKHDFVNFVHMPASPQKIVTNHYAIFNQLNGEEDHDSPLFSEQLFGSRMADSSLLSEQVIIENKINSRYAASEVLSEKNKSATSIIGTLAKIPSGTFASLLESQLIKTKSTKVENDSISQLSPKRASVCL